MKRNILCALGFAFVIALFVITAMYSYGFDDEIYNFFMVEKLNSLSAIEKFVNSTDFHTVGMYFINYILFRLLGNWNLVKAAGGIVCACAVWPYWYVMSRNIHCKAVLIFSYIAACLCPSALLWGTGVRWYAYLMPLVVILALLIHSAGTRKISGVILWGIYFFTCLLMFHINYFSSVIILISFIFMLFKRKIFLRSEWKYLACYSVLSLLLASYQMYILLTVHFKNNGGFSHRFGFSLGGAMNYLSGSAVMPISVYGVVLIIANLLLILVFLRNIKHIFSNCDNNFFMALYTSMMLLLPGFNNASRCFSILSPELGIFLTKIFLRIKNKFLKIFILVLFIIGTAGGIYNVITHNDTTKITYNMPYAKILSYINSLDAEKNSLLITNLPGLYFFARGEYKNAVLIPDDFTGSNVWGPLFADWYDTLKNWRGKIIAIRTHKSLTLEDDYKKYISYLDSANVIEKRTIGIDKFAPFKRIFQKDLPDYYALVYFIDNEKNNDE